MIIPNLTYEEYCDLPGFNSSLLKIVDAQSLEHAKAYLDGRLEKNSDALDFGHSFHELLLRDRREYIIRPDTYPAPPDHKEVKAGKIEAGAALPWNGNARICKDWLADHNPGGKIVHTQEEVASLESMVAAVRANAELAPYLADAQSEVAITAERNGISYKCLTDLLPSDPSAPIIDFKKAKSCNPAQFTKDAIRNGYHLQGALNLDLFNWNATGPRRTHFWNVAIEACAPFSIWICRFEDTDLSFIRSGRIKYRAATNKLNQAMKSGNWPGYQSGRPEEHATAYMIAELEATT